MSNPDIGRVSLSVQNGGLGARMGSTANVLCIAGAVPTGTTKVLKQYSSAAALIAVHGLCAATEKAADFIEDTEASVLFYPMPIGTAGKVYTPDVSAKAGTSAFSITGTPRDDYRFKFEVLTAGTIGTAGIVFRYSLDGGRVWSPGIALGTASTYAVPNTGMTLNFGAGTLALADTVTAHTDGPRLDSADFADAFEAFGASSTLWPAMIVPETITKTKADDLAAELATYATSRGRETFAFVCASKPYETVNRHQPADLEETLDNIVWSAWGAGPPIVKGTAFREAGSWLTLGVVAGMKCDVSGSDLNDATGLTVFSVTADTITFAETDVGIVLDADDDSVTFTFYEALEWTAYGAGPPVVPGTCIRAVGSWVDLGVKAGMQAVVTGSPNAGTLTVQTVSATTITWANGDTGVVLDAIDNTSEIVFSEPYANYQARHRAEWDAFSDLRVAYGAAAVQCASPVGVARWRFRRSPAWAAATRFFQYGPEVSLAKVENGGLPSRYSLLAADGNLEEHDSNIEAGLASLDGSNGRAITCQQHDGYTGQVFICTPSMAHSVGSDFTRVHLRAVMDVACRTARPALILQLHGEHELKADGTLREDEALAIERSIDAELRKALRAGKPKCSRVWCTLRRTDILAVPGTTLGVTIRLVPLGYLENAKVTLTYTIEVVVGESE
jgi:hypothetical protein